MTGSSQSRCNKIISTIFDGIFRREETYSVIERKAPTLDPKPTTRPILGFGDHNLVDGTPNEKLPLLIAATIALMMYLASSETKLLMTPLLSHLGSSSSQPPSKTKETRHLEEQSK
ncbi:hypothetical protein A2U01_0029759 [Trifolium medium]|uniref:Uncharacterized protein n=1 Tax=Trifolium medium TaxID=97028 RepID=A0A392P976_9FABA|nr:hypothetical protein [Trifolium medium]